ncbi:family transcriptional regulator [Lasius niger]|uniref:Family transcriptional regulator n=1 Tax=Lasius niger TaxID=67767 RepID=A0A0J7KM93_LASNI|nr:family transcriptional regulator [Lasius niger]
MQSRVNLVVAILLTLNCVSRAMEYSRSLQEKRQEEEERAVTYGRKVLRYTYNNVTSESLISPTGDRIARGTLAEMHIQDVHSTQPRSGIEERGN